MRRRLWGGVHLTEKVEDVKNVVALGFFIEQAYDVHHAAVFNMTRPQGKSRQDVSITQIREVPQEVADRLDRDEVLSAVRELYFYKTYAYMYESKHPKQELVVGANVLWKKKEYALIQRDDDHALIENEKGQTEVVKVANLSRGFAKSTLGHFDDHFDVSGDLSMQAGQWIFVPARAKYKDAYEGCKYELAVICAILQEHRIHVYMAMDGISHFVDDDDVIPLDKGNQQSLNAHAEFKRFKDASVHKDEMKTVAYALGNNFARLCAGLFQNMDHLVSVKEQIDKKAEVGERRYRTKLESQTKGKTLKKPEPEVSVGKETVGFHPKPKSFDEMYEEPDIYAEEDSGFGAGLVVVAFLAAYVAMVAG